MGDGRQWAAEQDELEADERAEQELKRRIELLKAKFNDPARPAFAITFIHRLDKIAEAWADMSVRELRLTRFERSCAEELDKVLRDVMEETRR